MKTRLSHSQKKKEKKEKKREKERKKKKDWRQTDYVLDVEATGFHFT